MMGLKLRNLFDGNQQQEDTLAEIVSHAISRVEILKGKDSICVAEEYKEWLGEDFDDDILVLRKIQNKL